MCWVCNLQVILHLKPKTEGLLTIIGLGFELQANSVESPATGKIPSITGELVCICSSIILKGSLEAIRIRFDLNFYRFGTKKRTKLVERFVDSR